MSTLHRVVREDLTEEVTSELRPEMGKGLVCSSKVMFSSVRDRHTPFPST